MTLRPQSLIKSILSTYEIPAIDYNMHILGTTKYEFILIGFKLHFLLLLQLQAKIYENYCFNK